MNEDFNLKVSVKQYDPLEDDYIKKIYLKEKYVSDGIKNCYKEWSYTTPIIISSQTGTGKNTFIENILIPYSKEMNKKILIISNRIAVNRQSKRRIAKIIGYDQCLEELTDIGLDRKETFDNVTIVSYQKLNSYLTNNSYINFNKFFIVIYDEAHFFISDSLFNNMTEKLLDTSLELFKTSIRIYLSATPCELLPLLIKKEKNLHYNSLINYLSNNNNLPQMRYYDFKRNYSYLNIKYFEHKKSLLSNISMSKHESKWMIFVSSKNIGKELAEKIGKDAIFIDATSKNSKDPDGEIYNEIISNEMFSCRVLISTCVLDNGVNIKDPLVENIVIFSYDKTQFLQMLGRKRMLSNESVTLFIYSSNIKEINHKLSLVNKQITYICEFIKNPSFILNQCLGKSDLMSGLIFFDKNSIPHINKFAEIKLYNLKTLYEELIINFQSIGKKAFILKQLDWINLKKAYNQTFWIDYEDCDRNKKKLIEFLDCNCNVPLSDQALQNFQDKFKELLIETYGKQPGDRPDRPYKAAKMRNLFSIYKLAYEITIKNKIFTLSKK